MNLPLQLEPGMLLLIVGALCTLGVVLIVVMPVVGTLFDLIGMVGGLLTGDPSSCCGCILLLSILSACGVIAMFVLSVLSTCGTPEAVTFCEWVGR